MLPQLYQLIVDYGDAEEVLENLTVDEVADFIDMRYNDGAIGFGVYPQKA